MSFVERMDFYWVLQFLKDDVEVIILFILEY